MVINKLSRSPIRPTLVGLLDQIRLLLTPSEISVRNPFLTISQSQSEKREAEKETLT